MKISWYSHCPVLNPQWYLDNSLYSHESSSIALFYQGAYLLQSGPVQKICEEKIIDKKFISKKVSMYPLRLYLIFWSLNWNVRVWMGRGREPGNLRWSSRVLAACSLLALSHFRFRFLQWEPTIVCSYRYALPTHDTSSSQNWNWGRTSPGHRLIA